MDPQRPENIQISMTTVGIQSRSGRLVSIETSSTFLVDRPTEQLPSSSKATQFPVHWSETEEYLAANLNKYADRDRESFAREAARLKEVEEKYKTAHARGQQEIECQTDSEKPKIIVTRFQKGVLLTDENSAAEIPLETLAENAALNCCCAPDDSLSQEEAGSSRIQGLSSFADPDMFSISDDEEVCQIKCPIPCHKFSRTNIRAKSCKSLQPAMGKICIFDSKESKVLLSNDERKDFLIDMDFYRQQSLRPDFELTCETGEDEEHIEKPFIHLRKTNFKEAEEDSEILDDQDQTLYPEEKVADNLEPTTQQQTSSVSKIPLAIPKVDTSNPSEEPSN